MPKDTRISSLSFVRSRASPYPYSPNNSKQYTLDNPAGSIEDVKEWEEARCPICMEHPHNAILLQCASYEKGCRPYMCDTSYRHSNCLDQFSKSSGSSPLFTPPQEVPLQGSTSHGPREEGPVPGQTRVVASQVQPQLVCPLCRGEVYGLVVIEPARCYMNAKPRSCSCETCEFTGTYSELRKHARSEHPTIRPSEVDPTRQSDWRRMEHEREFQDVLSIVTSGFANDEMYEDSLSSEDPDDSLLSSAPGNFLDFLEIILFMERFSWLGHDYNPGPDRLPSNRSSERTTRETYDMGTRLETGVPSYDMENGSITPRARYDIERDPRTARARYGINRDPRPARARYNTNTCPRPARGRYDRDRETRPATARARYDTATHPRAARARYYTDTLQGTARARYYTETSQGGTARARYDTETRPANRWRSWERMPHFSQQDRQNWRR